MHTAEDVTYGVSFAVHEDLFMAELSLIWIVGPENQTNVSQEY